MHLKISAPLVACTCLRQSVYCYLLACYRLPTKAVPIKSKVKESKTSFTSTPKQANKESIPCLIAVSRKTPFDFRKTTIPTHDFYLSENKKPEHNLTPLAAGVLDL